MRTSYAGAASSFRSWRGSVASCAATRSLASAKAARQSDLNARNVIPREATALVVWPAYRISIERIVGDLADPARAAWFELSIDGRRKTP